MYERFYETIGEVSRTVTRFAADRSRPVIGVMPAYFPLELVWAAGGYPVQLWGNNLPIERADAYLQSYCCSVARSMLELELRGSASMVEAYAFTSLCDTLINLREVYRRLFDKPTLELSIPITRTEAARKQYLRHVVNRLIEALGGITGTPVDGENLRRAARIYGRQRELQRELYALRRSRPGLIKNRDFYAAVKAGFFLPPDEYSRLLEALLAQLRPLSPPAGRRTRLLLSGMVFDPLAAYEMFDEMNAAVVDDDFANGWRSVSKAPLAVDDLVAGITDYLFAHAPCCCIYNPENDRHPYLIEQARGCEADGVIFWYVKFCEPDAFDRPQLMERLKQSGIPATTVDLELSQANFDAMKTRVSAFCEMLEG